MAVLLLFATPFPAYSAARASRENVQSFSERDPDTIITTRLSHAKSPRFEPMCPVVALERVGDMFLGITFDLRPPNGAGIRYRDRCVCRIQDVRQK